MTWETSYKKRAVSDYEWGKSEEERKKYEEWKKAEEKRKQAEEEWMRQEAERREKAARKARIKRELDDEFEFYLQFVKSLVLYMHNIKGTSLYTSSTILRTLPYCAAWAAPQVN